jgi:hypothetical protein
MSTLTIKEISTITFDFLDDKQSTRQMSKAVKGADIGDTVQAFLTSFNMEYTADDRHYDFGQMQIQLEPIQGDADIEIQCTATLRDDKIDQRRWAGQVVATALVLDSST